MSTVDEMGSVVSLVDVGAVVELLVDELLGGTVVLVLLLLLLVVVVVVEEVMSVVVVRLARAMVVGAGVVEVGAARLDRGRLTDVARLDGGATVTVAWELRWRGTTVVVVGRGSATARCRGLVTNPARLPPTAPMRTAAITEDHRRDSTNRIGLKAGSPPVKPPSHDDRG